MDMKEDVVGVALTKTVCNCCGEERDGDIVINTRLTTHLASKVKEMDGKVVNSEPCDSCKGYMEQGIIILGVIEAKSDSMDNPYRSGAFVVLKESAVRMLMEDSDILDSVLKKRVAFMEHSLMVDLEMIKEEVL